MNIDGEDDDDGLIAALDAELDAGKAPAEPVKAPEGETPAEEQARYVREGRRFVKEQKDDPAAKSADAKPTDPAQAVGVKAWSPLWLRQEHGVEWDKLPEAFRKQLEQRERESAQGIEKHSSAAKAWEPINEAIKPYEAQLRAQGQTPQQFLGGLVNIYSYLQQDPVQALNWLASSTLGQGWDIRSLADWMDQQGVQTQQPDPMKQELEALKQQVLRLTSLPQEQQQASIRTTITEWSKDKPHYADVERIIVGLIQADPSVRERFRVDAKATLDSLYEQAQWAHPQLRQRISDDQRRAEVERARAAAGTSPRSGAGQAGAPRKPAMSLEEELGMRLDGTI